jgi:hypothetical protein
MVIINYNEHCKKLIENGFDKVCNIRDLVILAKCWKENGCNKSQIQKKLFNFLEEWDKNFTTVKANNKICATFKKSVKDLPPLSEKISFSISEIEFIKAIKEYDLQKILFVIMAIAKTQNNDYIYLSSTSSMKLKDIFSLANVSSAQQKQEFMLNELYKLGAISPTYGLRYNICCIDTNIENNLAFEFAPNQNLVLEYEFYIGKAIKCKKCGKLVHKTNNKMKYCKNCAKIVRLEYDKIYYDKFRK